MKKLQLMLDNPCTENWDEMRHSTNGRYCGNCTKQVVDLTTKTDAELIDFFSKKKDNICGRLLSSQLNRQVAAPIKKTNWQWLMSVALSIGIISPAEANSNKTIVHKEHGITAFKKSLQPAFFGSVIIDTLNGNVVAEGTAQPLAGVKIKRKGFDNVIAITDSLGNFELSVDRAEIPGLLLFEINGYERTEMSPSANMVVKMQSMRIVVGMVSTITTKEPLYAIHAGNKNCIVSPEQFKSIQANWIESITIMKDEKAIGVYGVKGANGVINIKIKDEYATKITFSNKL